MNLKTQNHIFTFFFLSFKNKLQSLERGNVVNNFICDLTRMCTMFIIERLQKKGALNLFGITKSLNM